MYITHRLTLQHLSRTFFFPCFPDPNPAPPSHPAFCVLPHPDPYPARHDPSFVGVVMEAARLEQQSEAADDLVCYKRQNKNGGKTTTESQNSEIADCPRTSSLIRGNEVSQCGHKLFFPFFFLYFLTKQQNSCQHASYLPQQTPTLMLKQKLFFPTGTQKCIM